MLRHYSTVVVPLCCTIVSLCKIASAVNAACECIIFDDTYGKEYGFFTSPNWPVPYDDNIDCLLYTFMANNDQIVEITFDEFSVQKTNLDCVFGDFVKLFLHLSGGGINEESQWNIILCGKIADIEQTYYSSNSSLIFEFHSDWRNGNNTGFRGTFRFLNKQMFRTDGALIPKTKCDYKFSSDNSNGSVTTGNTRGRFYSPQYPSTYPKNLMCAYYFEGRPLERVKLVLEHVRLQKSDLSCLNSNDVIYVYDGRNTSSPVIGQICNTNSYVELISTGPFLFVEFHSRSHFPGQGFKAKYIFDTIASDTNNGPDAPSTEPDNHGKKHTSKVILQQQTALDCDQWISSDTSKNGTFTSPNFPDPYPANVHCSYHFNGRGKERVQILFTDFELYKPEDISRDCDASDAVMVFITINGQKERIDNFCGNELPPQLMSNGPSMSVEFKSSHSNDHVRGFRAIYRFVTNFGIKSGKQDPQSVCGFNFNSTDRSNGSFTSPNYPGFYPRDTECHYFFYGNASEKVHITFAFFDIEGVTPCTTVSASDYVEFSNYRTVDRHYPRHCGLKIPKVVKSDADFFRVTFKSNDRFDGKGFEAFYQFRNQNEDTFNVKKVRGTSASTYCTSNLVLMATIVISILLESIIIVD